jgi:hypothetical protein
MVLIDSEVEITVVCSVETTVVGTNMEVGSVDVSVVVCTNVNVVT